MKKAIVTFPLQTGSKKRLITTYRDNPAGQELRNKHNSDLKQLETNYQLDTNVSFAYIKNQSIKHLVNKHLPNSYFYQFDISNFFGSIDHSLLLQKMTTTDSQFNEQLIAECSNQKEVGLCLGLVPSPFLSNIYMDSFDQQLQTYLNQLDCTVVYTRYSDDFTISSSKELDINELTIAINKLLAELNLQLNNKKTKVSSLDTKGQHLKILGLNIIRGQETNYITVGRKFKANAKSEKNPLVAAAMNSYINYNER